MLKISDFDYALPPPEQIAQYPLSTRSESRLLSYEREQKIARHRQFHDITDYLSAGDLLIFNNTKVIPARLFGQKETGGRVEILFERMGDSPRKFLAHLRVSKALRAGARINLMLRQDVLVGATGSRPSCKFVKNDQGRPPVAPTGNYTYSLEMLERQGDLFLLQLADATPGNVYDCLEACGHIPLPPYIQRSDTLEDQTRYQTVYAEQLGAVAAPTAGLHFDTALLEILKQKGIQQNFLTLHVGAGTFQPVRVDVITEHKMHAEYLEVSQALCEHIAQTKQAGGRVIAVGTTVVRALESAALSGKLQPYSGDTDIFITPGFEFKVIDGLITNFHWPRSTLLMLVSALIGREQLLSLYQEASSQGYRFFSYGDAMLIL